MGVFNWIFGKHPPRPVDPERSIEAAWVPLWQAHLILLELTDRDVRAVVSEDFASNLAFGVREPMARIFVMEPDLAEARTVIEDVTGQPPNTQHI